MYKDQNTTNWQGDVSMDTVELYIMLNNVYIAFAFTMTFL